MSPIRQQLAKGKNKIRSLLPLQGASDPFSAMAIESETSLPSNTTGVLLEAANNNGNQSQMLSQSLNSPILDTNEYIDYRQRNDYSDFIMPCHSLGESPLPAGIGTSRYLRSAQSLLEEVVRVRDNVKGMPNDDECLQKFCGGICGDEAASTDRIEIQAKLAKLIHLQEVVQTRFESYYHRMEEAVTSFEAAAGLGPEKSYPALALQAMSWHFCSLRLVIASQIKEMRRKRFLLQQLGSILHQQSQALWPIRGLPETSAVILRDWLFEHLSHPYPNDSEKLTLASQTGLSKHQVSNWFINARVHLWKTMIADE